METMKAYIRTAMEAGASGFSTGLDYDPTTQADLEEVVELVEVVAEYGGIYTTHIRGHTQNVLNAVAEAVEVGRRTGVPVQVSHLGISGRENWGAASRLLYLMDKARGDGVQVSFDMMAYPTSGAWWAPRAVLPKRLYDWHRSWDENLECIRKELSDPKVRRNLAQEIEERRQSQKFGFEQEALIFSHWEDILIEELPEGSLYSSLLGLDMATAAEAAKREPVDLYLDLLLHEGEEFGAVRIAKSPEDFDALLQSEWGMFCTDSVGTAIYLLGEPWVTIQPHPRHYGTFPRILAKFVRDEQIIPLEQAVRRMSGLPADHFGLEQRGYIREGCWADLVIVDLENLRERGTWRLPSAYPEGIDHVFVNGVEAVSQGQFTGKLGGQMLTAKR
jgi:N-acyl-D-aspartate/D-glutamate deacylase